MSKTASERCLIGILINFKKFIQIRINSWRFQEILWNPCVYFGFLSLPIDSSAEDYQRLRARGFWGISKDSYNFSEEIIRVPNDSKICRGNFPKRSQEEIFISDFRGHSHFSTILKYILKDSLEEVSDGFLMEVETYPACGRPARNGSDGIMQNTILFLHKLPVDWQTFMCIYSLKLW